MAEDTRHLRGVLVVGTDTGIGATIVCAAIAATWRTAGRDVVYVKPVQPGAADGADDAADVAALADVPTVVGPVLGSALAPGMAARLAGEELTGDELAEVVRGATDGAPAASLVVDGVGGLLVELGSDGTTCADLAERLGLPVLVVTGLGPGTLNHTALTLAELDRRGLPVAGVVVSGHPDDSGPATRMTLAELDRVSAGRLLAVLPQLAQLAPGQLDWRDDRRLVDLGR